MSGRRPRLAASLLLAVIVLAPGALYACNGTDVVLSDDPAAMAAKALLQEDGKTAFFDAGGDLLFDRSRARVSPGLALEIASRFLRENLAKPPFPLSFHKLEYVHGKLIYQFQSERLPGYEGKYHLGPVNFIVDRLVLDVDAETGDLYLANGCGAAPGQLLSRYDHSAFPGAGDLMAVSNNTNFIARRTGNAVKVDGVIEPDEWKDTGHRYFYLGTYEPHAQAAPHKKPFYHVEVWSQISGGNIYFAVKTYSPYWVALMFKDDPNLGMLGAYTDAKVMKSDGEITDRHFTQRQDKTFFLANDNEDDIIAKAARQGDAYTYEFAFPLDSGDPEDVSLQEGKAYNMLVLVGNTLEHYGIFTMDPAHKNHAHSKNNREHADVWASNETTLRIGRAADTDIYGRPVRAALAGFVSGFDPSRNDAHFHYAGTTMNNFGARAAMAHWVEWLSFVFAFGALGLMITRLKSPRPGGPEEDNGGGLDLMRVGWIRRFLTWKYFRHVFIFPTLAVFLLIVYVGFFDVQDGRRNVATVYTWSLWWGLIIISFTVAGRSWCMMCPFAALGDWAQKLFSLNRRLPRRLQNMGFQTLAFIALTWAFTTLALPSRPMFTAVLIVAILAAAVLFSMVFRRRSFCRHICPIGAVIGVYSMVSPIELRPCDRGRCSAHRRKTCSEACPMLESPQDMDNNVYCNFCMECRSACPGGNLSLRLRALGKDIYASARKTSSEAVASLFLLGIIMVETLSMTSPWQPLKDGFSAWSGIRSPLAVYSVFFAAVVLIPVAAFYLACWLLKLWMGREGGYRVQGLATQFAFVFVPLSVGLHLAHNFQHLFIEGPLAVPATLRFLENAGYATSLFINWNPAPLLGAAPLFVIQMAIVVGALALTMTVLYRLLRRFNWSPANMCRAAVVMSLYALTVVLASLYLLGLPMSARHVH